MFLLFIRIAIVSSDLGRCCDIDLSYIFGCGLQDLLVFDQAVSTGHDLLFRLFPVFSRLLFVRVLTCL